jgi:hypothetical protein
MDEAEFAALYKKLIDDCFVPLPQRAEAALRFVLCRWADGRDPPDGAKGERVPPQKEQTSPKISLENNTFL